MGPFLIGILLFSLAGAASPAPFDGPREEIATTALRDGNFQRAVEFGRAAGSARGSALAAWAELTQGRFLAPPSERRQALASAERDAHKALALDPDAVDGHLALATTLGFIAQQEGGVAAHFEGLARQARTQIDAALALDPANPWANALLGGWNLEIVIHGGPIGARLYGATLEDGKAAYARALSLDPGNTQIAYQYALELLALDGGSDRNAARSLLSGIIARPPPDAVDSLIQGHAKAVSAALEARDERRLAGLLQDELGRR